MTRHNAGFLFVDFLRKELGFEEFRSDKKLSAELSSGMIGSEKVIIMKPETFMNTSGTPVQSIMHFYKLSPSDITIVHDDLDIAPGTLRTTDSSRAAGHNGVQDIIDKLGLQDFFRIRLGIGRPARIATRNVAGGPTEVLGACQPARSTPRSGVGGPSHDYVLGKLSSDELAQLSGIFPKAKDEILTWLSTKH